MISPDSEVESLSVEEGHFVILGNGTGPSHRYYISSEVGADRVHGFTVINLQFAATLGLIGKNLGAEIRGIDSTKALTILSIETEMVDEKEPVPAEL